MYMYIMYISWLLYMYDHIRICICVHNVHVFLEYIYIYICIFRYRFLFVYIDIYTLYADVQATKSDAWVKDGMCPQRCLSLVGKWWQPVGFWGIPRVRRLGTIGMKTEQGNIPRSPGKCGQVNLSTAFVQLNFWAELRRARTQTLWAPKFSELLQVHDFV